MRDGLLHSCQRAFSARARARRPLPSSKGWMLTKMPVRQRGAGEGGEIAAFVETRDEALHFLRDLRGRRSLEMDALAAFAPGDDLHGIAALAIGSGGGKGRPGRS